MENEDKLKDFLTNINKLKLKMKLEKQNITSADEDPSKFILRNLELANVWETYAKDRK